MEIPTLMELVDLEIKAKIPSPMREIVEGLAQELQAFESCPGCVVVMHGVKPGVLCTGATLHKDGYLMAEVRATHGAVQVVVYDGSARASKSAMFSEPVKKVEDLVRVMKEMAKAMACWFEVRT